MGAWKAAWAGEQTSGARIRMFDLRPKSNLDDEGVGGSVPEFGLEEGAVDAGGGPFGNPGEGAAGDAAQGGGGEGGRGGESAGGASAAYSRAASVQYSGRVVPPPDSANKTVA